MRYSSGALGPREGEKEIIINLLAELFAVRCLVPQKVDDRGDQILFGSALKSLLRTARFSPPFLFVRIFNSHPSLPRLSLIGAPTYTRMVGVPPATQDVVGLEHRPM